jgi:hypothetical protein
MDLNLTDIVVVLDRSGSMSTLADDTIGGFNSFVDKQRNGAGRARLTLAQFDHEYEVVYERREIESVPHLDRASYVPRGNTALLDAIGRTIHSVRGRIASEVNGEGPSGVVFVIITDGQENASRKFTRAHVLDLIQEQQKAGWEFLFFGANQDAIGEAGAIGIGAANAASWKKAQILHDVYAEKLARFRREGNRLTLQLDEDDRVRLESDDDGNGPYN